MGDRQIRKDYPTTGVLKLFIVLLLYSGVLDHQEGLPDYWGIETPQFIRLGYGLLDYQEGLPDYWGIETLCDNLRVVAFFTDQEGLPDYWGIETYLF